MQQKVEKPYFSSLIIRGTEPIFFNPVASIMSRLSVTDFVFSSSERKKRVFDLFLSDHVPKKQL